MNIDKLKTPLIWIYKVVQPVYFYTDPVETTTDKIIARSALIGKAKLAMGIQ